MEFFDYDTRLAAYALIIDDGRVLLSWFNGGTRGAEPGWSLPGGGVDFEESIEDGIIREVFEETGYHVELDAPLTTHSFTLPHDDRTGRPFKSVRVVYLAHVVGGQLGTQEVGGTTDHAAWLALSKVSEEPRVARIINVALDAWSQLT